MKWNNLAVFGAAATAYAAPQTGGDNRKPSESAPDGCKTSYDGKFYISIVKHGNAKVCLKSALAMIL